MTRLIQRFLLIWLSLLSLAAYYWPDFGIEFDPFQHTAKALPYLIIVTMFGVGWMLPIDEIKKVVSQWPKIIGGTLTQFLVMPFLALGIGLGFGLSGETLVGVILVGCVPGAMASNVLTIVSKGNTSYSVSLTTLATILSPIAVPTMLAISASVVDQATREVIESASSNSSSVYLDSAIKLLKWVVIPVIAGFSIGRLLPQYESQAKIVGSNVANLAILLIVATVVGKSRDHLSMLPIIVFACLLLLNILGYLGGFTGGTLMKLTHPMKRALTLEVGMQNAGLGATLATQLFTSPDSTVAIAPAFYTFFCMFTGTILAWYWSTKPVSDDQPQEVSQHEYD
ncbi:MAG: hypothetical protein CMJ76_04030 [Planctomycetaceae bacterium]|nr:hypothetical protein [Planctomycetaceae bacterium]